MSSSLPQFLNLYSGRTYHDNWMDPLIYMILYSPDFLAFSNQLKTKSAEELIDVMKQSDYYKSNHTVFVHTFEQLFEEILKEYIIPCALEQESVPTKETLNKFYKLLYVMENPASLPIEITDQTTIKYNYLTKLFYVLMSMFDGADKYIETSNLHSWHPFTGDADFDNSVYAASTNENATHALTVHGILKDNTFSQNNYLMRILILTPSTNDQFRQNNELYTFETSFQSVFKTGEDYKLYDPVHGLKDFNLCQKPDFQTHVLDEKKLMENLGSFPFDTDGLFFKDDYQMIEVNRWEEASIHNIFIPKKIENVRKENYSLINVYKEGKLLRGLAKIYTSHIMPHFYKEDDILSRFFFDTIVKEFHKETAKPFTLICKNLRSVTLRDNKYYVTFESITQIPGDKLARFTEFEYFGQSAYVIDEDGNKISEEMIVSSNEFEIGKSYMIDKQTSNTITKLFSNTKKIIENPKYDNIHVGMTDVNLIKTDGTFGKFNKLDPSFVIIYASQDTIKNMPVPIGEADVDGEAYALDGADDVAAALDDVDGEAAALDDVDGEAAALDDAEL